MVARLTLASVKLATTALTKRPQAPSLVTMVAQLPHVTLPLVTMASPPCKERKFAPTIPARLLLAPLALVGII